MIPSGEEVVRSMRASLRLIRGDAAGLGGFNLSVEGFWRSFGAVVFISPILVVQLAAEEAARRAAGEPDIDRLRFILVEALGVLCDWAAFPLLLLLLLPAIGAAGREIPYVIAHNWTSVWIALLTAPPSILYALGLASLGTAGFLSLILVGLAVRCRFVVARTALGIGSGAALMLVVVEFMLSIVISRLFDALSG